MVTGLHVCGGVWWCVESGGVWEVACGEWRYVVCSSVVVVSGGVW